MRIISILVLLVLLINSCTNKPKQVALRHVPNTKELSLLDREFTSLAKDLDIKGLFYAIVNEKQVIYAKGIGFDTSGKNPSSENTVYPIGSLSHIFLSTIIMQLSEAEKVNLKSTISEYGIISKEIGSATIKQILSHTSAKKAGTIFAYDASRIDLLDDVLKASSGKNFYELLQKKITRKFDMNDTKLIEKDGETPISTGCVSTVADLAKFSMAIDQRILFKNENTTDDMFRPVYLDNGAQSPASSGWMIQYFNDKKYAWCFGQTSTSSSLIIKSLTDSVSLVVLANSPNLNKPFNLHNGNMLTSPIILAFLKACILRNDTLNTVSFHADTNTIKTALEKAKASTFRDLSISELLDYINMYRFMKNNADYNRLISIYKELFPKDIPYNLLDKEPRAVIKDVSDYVVIKKPFHIENDTIVNVFAVGEFVKEFVMQEYLYDAVEMYLDINNEKKSAFDNTKNRQYRFNYDSPAITGMFSTSENIKFVQADPSKNSYLFEIGIPWKTLNSTKPKDGLKIGFDMNSIDNDGKEREGFIQWHFNKDDKPWENPSAMGTMLLCNNPVRNTNDSLCYSTKAMKTIIIDGKIEQEWTDAPKYIMGKTIFDKMPENKDMSACFQSKWDNDNLYVLVEITDDIKNQLSTTSDIGWIENEKHDTVWIMNKENTQYAGGELSNRFVNTTIPLKKGNYTLNYNTNQTNSYYHRINKRPDISFYGIALY
jgi:CubicO group peptidase (beta-lactamase class C family)